MKICLYSPYFPNHFGGGEKYLLDVAQVLAAANHQVSIAITAADQPIDATSIKQAYETFFDIDLSHITLISTPIGTPKAWWRKLLWTAQFDVMYYITDGSLWFSLARRNILHIQIPFKNGNQSLIDKLKLANWSIKNTNSEFTKSVVSAAWQTKIDFVHHPMIEPPANLNLGQLQASKQKVILNVGRFFRQLHTKRQDVLVTIFKDLREKHETELKDWKLVLIGGIEDQSYADEVKALATGLPVEFYHELNRTELDAWYQQAAIYWHAAGFEIDQTKFPEKVEHFGITTVEAMSYAAAPVVIGKGGQPEVLGSELHKWLWQSTDECLELSYSLITNPSELMQLQAAAYQRALAFDRQAFAQTLTQMIGS